MFLRGLMARNKIYGVYIRIYRKSKSKKVAQKRKPYITNTNRLVDGEYSPPWKGENILKIGVSCVFLSTKKNTFFFNLVR